MCGVCLGYRHFSVVLTTACPNSSILCGIPVSQLKSLQTVLHASTLLTYRWSRSGRVSPLHDLGWISIEQHRIAFRLALFIFSCRLGKVSSYLISEFYPVSSQLGCSRLHSAESQSLHVLRTRHPTLGGFFLYLAVRVWNASPISLTSNNGLSLFKSQLKLHFLSWMRDPFQLCFFLRM